MYATETLIDKWRFNVTQLKEFFTFSVNKGNNKITELRCLITEMYQDRSFSFHDADSSKYRNKTNLILKKQLSVH
jgi:hypothetical protein